MKKVLVIGYVWPEPNSSAASSHLLSILQQFTQQNWHVEFASPAQQTDHMANLADIGISSHPIMLNCDSFDNYITDYQPDIVLFDRFMMEEQFGWRVEKHYPNALRILDTEDLQCLRHARQQAHKANRDVSQADLFSDLAKREIAAILRSDLSLIISPYEMALLQDTFNIDSSLLHYLPFLIDIESLPAASPAFSERQHFITIGNFRHDPNWDAVLYLQEIWPKIRQQLPNAELHIYGAYPPPKATALNNPKTGFLIKGWVNDALAVIKQARICLAPLRFGAGLKGKLLDAMIAQTPSITTPIGSEGMQQNHPWAGAVTDNIDDFITAAVHLYHDETAWQQAQQHGAAILAQYDSQPLGKQLIENIHHISKSLHQHRLNNFTGAMLNHHTMKSTQYMSQWIAAKNNQN